MRYIAGHNGRVWPMPPNCPQSIKEHKVWWGKQKPGIPYGECWCGCGAPTELAPKTCAKEWAVKGAPRRFVRGHQTRKPLEYTVEHRGYNTPCWIWTHHRTQQEYAQFMRNRKVEKAHRYMYRLYKGGIPAGLVLDHLCRVHYCVNPFHLEAVTQAVNTQRGKHNKKLSDHELQQMIELHNTGDYTQQHLADIYNINQSGVCRHIRKAKSA